MNRLVFHFFFPAWKHYVVSAGQKLAGISTMALSLCQSNKEKVDFIDGTGSPIWDFNRRITTTGTELARATSVTRKIGNDITGELVFELSIERF